VLKLIRYIIVVEHLCSFCSNSSWYWNVEWSLSKLDSIYFGSFKTMVY